MDTLHCYAENMAPAASEKMADLVSAMYMKSRQGFATVASGRPLDSHNGELDANSETSDGKQGVTFSDIPPPDGKQRVLSQRLQYLAQHYTVPSQKTIDTEMETAASWIPAALLHIHDKCAAHLGAATLFQWRYCGTEKYKTNQKFAEMFGTQKEIDSISKANEQAWKTEFVQSWVDGQAEVYPELENGPEVAARIVATTDIQDFAMLGIRCIMASTDSQHASTEPAIILMKLSDGTLQLCRIERHAWMSPGGERSCMVFLIHPLPQTPYLQMTAVVQQKQPRKKRRTMPVQQVKDLGASELTDSALTAVVSTDNSNGPSETTQSALASSDEWTVIDDDFMEALGAIQFDLTDMLDPESDIFGSAITPH